MDVLNAEQVPANDRLWVVLREEFIDAKTLRLFGCWCARESLKLVEKPDPRLLSTIEIAERYACGKATKEELRVAELAARSVAWSVASQFTQPSEVWSVSECVARSAAMTASESAFESALESATWAARSDESAARPLQIEKLKSLLA
jgi:hypothetical protein